MCLNSEALSTWTVFSSSGCRIILKSYILRPAVHHEGEHLIDVEPEVVPVTGLAAPPVPSAAPGHNSDMTDLSLLSYFKRILNKKLKCQSYFGSFHIYFPVKSGLNLRATISRYQNYWM